MLKRAGRYEIVAELGRGGFGQVYRAFDPTLNSMVAIKTLSVENDASVLARFRNEAAASRRLHHPNIVTIFDFGEQDGTPFIVMELLEGQDLQRAIDTGKALPLWHKIQIMTQIASGLGHAHKNDIVHRDVKPANVMLLPDGNVKIMDFGIARVSRDTQNRLTPRGAVIGTFRYMAPEQFRGLEQDVRGDIFAYGLMFYELLSGMHPFHAIEPAALMYNILNIEPVPINEACPGCPEQVQPIIARLLQKDPDLRYQNLEDVLFDCEPILTDLRRARARDLFEEAQQVFADRQLEAAQTLLRQVMELDPSYPGARALRERTQTELRRLAVRPKVEALAQEAREQLAAGNPAEAIQRLKSAARLDSTDTALKAMLDQAEAALELSRKVLRLAASAERALSTGDLTGAHRLAQQAVELAPADAQARGLLSRAQAALTEQERQYRLAENLARLRRLIEIRSWDETAALLVQLEGEFPQFDELRKYRLALDLGKQADERQKKLAAGLTAARQEIHSRSFEAALNRLVALRSEFPDAGEIDQLLRFATSELETQKRSEFVERSLNAARALVDRNRFADATRLLQSALVRYPADPVLEREIRSVDSAQQQAERATAMRQALDAANALQAQGRWDEALAPLAAFTSRYEREPAVEELREAIERDREAARRAAELRALVRATALEEALTSAKTFLEKSEFDPATQALTGFTTRFGADPKVTELETLVRSGRQEWQRRVEEQRRLAEEQQRRLEEQRRQAEERRQFAEVQQRLLEEQRQRAEEQQRLIEEQERRAEEQRQVEEQQRRTEELNRMVHRTEALLAEGKALDAGQLLKSAPGYLKEHPDIARLRGAVVAQLRKEAEREAAVQAAVSASLALEQQARFDEALAALGAFVRQHGPDSRIAEREQAVRDAREVVRRAAEIQELAHRTRSFLAQDDPQAALTLLGQAPSLVREGPELGELLNAAESQLAAQRAREAIAAIESEARSLLHRGEFGAALKAIDGGLKRFPSAGELQSTRAEIAAAEEAQQLEALRERSIAQILNYTSQHDFERARGVWDAAQTKLSGDEELRRLQAEIELQSQSWEAAQAEEKFQESMRRAQELLASEPAESVALLQSLCAQYPGRPELAAQLNVAQAALQQAEERRLIQEAEWLCGQNRFPEALAKLSQANRETPAVQAARQQVETRRITAENERIAATIQAARENAHRDPSQALPSLEKLNREFPQRPEIAKAIEEIRAVIREYERQSAIAEIQELCAEGKFSKARSAHRKTVARFGSDAGLEDLLARIEASIQASAPPRPAPVIEPVPEPAPIRPAPAPALETTLTQPAPSPSKPAWVWPVAGLAAAAILGTGLWIATHRPSPPPAAVQIHLTVRTDPAGAAVQVGGRPCVTPNCQFDLAPGSYTIQAQLQGYATEQRTVTLAEAVRSVPVDLTLQPVLAPPTAGSDTGTLLIQAGLAGVQVIVDQAVAGVTDQGGVRVELEAKAHTVRVQKVGYDATPGEQKVTVTKNVSRTLVFKLTPQMSRLELRGAPRGIEVRADNTVIGRTDGSLFSGKVQPGDHVLRFSSGARDFPQKFEPGGTVTLDWSNLAIVTPPASTPTPAPPAPTPTPTPIAPPTVDPAERDWTTVSTSTDPAAIEDYLKKYPNSRHKAEAESRISDLAWNAIDQKDEQAVRRFRQQYPNSAHAGTAQSLIDQFEKLKQDAEKQKELERTKQQQAEEAKKQQDKQLETQRKLILDALGRLNAAFAQHNQRNLKAIWPSVPKAVADAATNTAAVLSFEPAQPMNIAGDQAVLVCTQTSKSAQGNRSTQVKLTFQKQGDGWIVQTMGPQ